MVPMRDGVCLATDVYRPDDLEEHTVLVHRIPYGKSIAHYVGSQMVNPILAASLKRPPRMTLRLGSELGKLREPLSRPNHSRLPPA